MNEIFLDQSTFEKALEETLASGRQGEEQLLRKLWEGEADIDG